MFEAVDSLKPLISSTAISLMENNGELSDQALIGLKLFEIRDYAGRLGSILTPYLAKKRPITDDDRNRIQQVFGRLEQLWEITRPFLWKTTELSESLEDVNAVFFGRGLKLVRILEVEAQNGIFLHTTKTMTDELVPTFASIEKIRSSYLDIMSAESQRKLRSATKWFLAVGFSALLVVGIILVLVIWTQLRIFNPLLLARDNIVALADERDFQNLTSKGRYDVEISEVFVALSVLQNRLSERQTVARQLKYQASTDPLTGLLNRRILDQVGQNLMDFEALPLNVGLILIDIDLFKTINGRHGHLVGERVIVAVAAAILEICGANDLSARFGGEEFAIILATEDPHQVEVLAENLRNTISKLNVRTDNPEALQFTVGIGASVGRRGKDEWDELFRAADKALYRAKAMGRNRVCLELNRAAASVKVDWNWSLRLEVEKSTVKSALGDDTQIQRPSDCDANCAATQCAGVHIPFKRKKTASLKRLPNLSEKKTPAGGQP